MFGKNILRGKMTGGSALSSATSSKSFLGDLGSNISSVGDGINNVSNSVSGFGSGIAEGISNVTGNIQLPTVKMGLDKGTLMVVVGIVLLIVFRKKIFK